MATAAQDIIDQIDAAILANGTGGLSSITFGDGRQKQFDYPALLQMRREFATKVKSAAIVPFGMARAKSGGVIC
jgi:hypothetical protein